MKRVREKFNAFCGSDGTRKSCRQQDAHKEKKKINLLNPNITQQVH